MLKNCTTCGYKGMKAVCNDCLFFGKWISEMDYAEQVAKICEKKYKEGDKFMIDMVEKLMKDSVYGAHPKSNFYNNLYIVNGNGILELNGNRYPVTITSADRSWTESVPEFKGNLNSVTPMEKSSKLNDAFIEYCENDVKQTRTFVSHRVSHRVPHIKNVLFREPATIVFWTDGTKTVVKAEGDIYDPEKGLAMAISKKALGNQGNYYEEFKKWLPEEEDVEPIYPNFAKAGAAAKDAAASLTKFIDAIIDKKKENKNA